MRRYIEIAGIVLVLFSTFSYGVVVERKEGVKIVSDRTEADFKDGIIIYSGNVKVTHLSMEFTATRVEEHRDKGELKMLKAFGEPVVFIDTLATEEAISEGSAETVVYYPESDKAVLTNYKLKESSGNKMEGKHGSFVLAK